MGREGYLNGKLMKKKNTFTDFIACADYLVEHKQRTGGATGACALPHSHGDG